MDRTALRPCQIADWKTRFSFRTEATITEREFKERTKKLALAAIGLADILPRGRAADGIARQLLRAGTSVGANYRAACRAKSKADMSAKLAIVAEEADETIYWLELLVAAHLVSENDVRSGSLLRRSFNPRSTFGIRQSPFRRLAALLATAFGVNAVRLTSA